MSGTPTDTFGLRHLEAESIYILREVVAQFEKPVLLYSIGKDSSVLLHLARKAYHPATIPFPLMHIDTGWKFREAIAFRDTCAAAGDFRLIIHRNEEGIKAGVGPLTHGASLHTEIMKTDALKQAIALHSFDAAIGGARRDEEKSRAKERIFSVRTAAGRWDPKSQRPEIWSIYNGRLSKGETMRVSPLSNWTELDIWRYIRLESIPVVSLYFAKERAVLDRDGMLIVRDDERMPLLPGETARPTSVRFRTLGCYPLSGAVLSTASTLDDVIEELTTASRSERASRLIDLDQAASMERKKRNGYF